MARMSSGSETRDQIAAIVRLRWRIFVNSLRTLRGRLELVSWIFMGLGFGVLGVAGTAGLGVVGWALVSRNETEWLAIPLWALFLFWQLFPIMATAFSENFDASQFLRFPLPYRTYFLVRLAYGTFDPATILCLLWLTGIAGGIGIASPSLLPVAALTLALFAAFNVLLSRNVFSWLERWLAQRKTREIFGVVFVLFVVSFQFIGPLTNYYVRHYGKNSRPEMVNILPGFLPAERLTPPGLAASALVRESHSDPAAALAALAVLCAYSGLFLWLLDVRLRAQYGGENLSESHAPAVAQRGQIAVRSGWNLPGISAPVTAILEKEFRYLSRSGPMLFLFLMPIVVLLLFRMGPAGTGRGHAPFAPGVFAFPLGAAYAVLMLGGVAYNCFGMDAEGVQFFFLAPLRFREVILGKNLAQACVLAGEITIVWAAAALIFHPPAMGMTLPTLAGVAFAAIVNFTVGNLLSLYAPKKIDPSMFGRQRASNITAFVLLGVQVVTFGLVGLAIFAAARFGRVWLATICLLALAAAAAAGYATLFQRIDRIALGRREALYGELCRTHAS